MAETTEQTAIPMDLAPVEDTKAGVDAVTAVVGYVSEADIQRAHNPVDHQSDIMLVMVAKPRDKWTTPLVRAAAPVVKSRNEIAVAWQKEMTKYWKERGADWSLPASEIPDYRYGGGGTIAKMQKCIRQDCDCFDMWSCSRPEINDQPLESEVLLREAIQTACDILAERTYGSKARSPGHNARLILEAALALKEGSS